MIIRDRFFLVLEVEGFSSLPFILTKKCRERKVKESGMKWKEEATLSASSVIFAVWIFSQIFL